MEQAVLGKKYKDSNGSECIAVKGETAHTCTGCCFSTGFATLSCTAVESLGGDMPDCYGVIFKYIEGGDNGQ